MIEFFRIGGYSMFSVLIIGLAGLVVALYASGRPSQRRIALAERLDKATLFFALAGYASNVAATFYTVSHREHSGDGMWMMAFAGLYESLAPVIMGFTFIALTQVALAIAVFRLSRLRDAP